MTSNKYCVAIYSMFNRNKDCTMETPILAPEGFDIIVIDEQDKEGFWNILPKIDALLIANNNLSEEEIERMDKCKIIARQGIGLDNIPLKLAEEKGITVCNVPDCSTMEVAEHATALMMTIGRMIPFYNDKIKLENQWNHRSFTVRPLREQTIFLVGFGKIAQQTAKSIRSHFGRVIAFDPYINIDKAKELDVEVAPSFEYGLKEADIVSLHIPLTKDSYHIINKNSLKIMKPTAFLINMSRGQHVDRDDLNEAINNGTIAGAALDVIEDELNVEKGDFSHPLFKNPMVIFTPHSGWYSTGSNKKARTVAAHEIVDFIHEKKLIGQANNPSTPRKFV